MPQNGSLRGLSLPCRGGRHLPETTYPQAHPLIHILSTTYPQPPKSLKIHSLAPSPPYLSNYPLLPQMTLLTPPTPLKTLLLPLDTLTHTLQPSQTSIPLSPNTTPLPSTPLPTLFPDPSCPPICLSAH